METTPESKPRSRTRSVSAVVRAPRAAGRLARHRHSVLLVEDDLESREALKEYLRLEGISVAAADDGEAALETLRAGFTPCVILLDMNMPGVNGATFQRERRREAVLANVPVIVISGNERLSAAECDAETVLVKPLDLAALRTAIAVTCPEARR
jgi:CheY-like chemotaxis protein